MSTSSVAVVPVDLPAPDAMRGRWAAFAAICAARGWGRSCHADGSRWHFDDGGGNWADLVHVGDGRAVLLGHDHEYSDTYYAEAAAYFSEPETDLLAGAPEWWAPPVRAAATPESWVGFAYGFDGLQWWRAPYDLDDGFASVGLPALDDARYRDLAAGFTEDAPGRVAVPGDDAFDALSAAGPEITANLLRVVVAEWDVDAGVAAAQRFRG